MNYQQLKQAHETAAYANSADLAIIYVVLVAACFSFPSQKSTCA